MIDQLLLIGQTQGMETVVAALMPLARETRAVRTIADLPSEEFQPQLVVALQHWPDEYSGNDVQQLMERYPLARLVVCQGPWCASDRRTRQYWPAAVCVPVSGFLERVSRETEVLSGRRSPLPWTAGLDEIFSFDHGG